MSSKTLLLHILALFATFTVTSAQLPQLNFGNLTSTALATFGDSLNNVPCGESTRAQAQCNLAPFSGTFVCREFGSIFGNPVRRTVCVRNIVQGFTLGLKSDVCGFCPEEGAAPEVCTCVCDEGKVLVEFSFLFFKRQLCVSNGFSQHATAFGNAASCVEECPAP
jgi:hypothetical protein